MDATAELYQRNIKTKALPDITENTWARFWSIWTSESLNYQTDHQKISVIRAKLVDGTECSITEPMTSLTEILAHLFQRYGSPATIYLSTLNPLESLPTPSTQAVILFRFLVPLCWPQQKKLGFYGPALVLGGLSIELLI